MLPSNTDSYLADIINAWKIEVIYFKKMIFLLILVDFRVCDSIYSLFISYFDEILHRMYFLWIYFAVFYFSGWIRPSLF